MNNVKVVPFEVAHLKLMDIREHELTGILTLKDIEVRLEALQALGEGGTLIYKGVILGALGFFEMWQGVCEVWVIPSTHITEYGLVFAKKIKEYLQMLQQVKNFHRIQVTALADARHERWLTWLGFKSEGTLEKYSMKQQNYKIWAKV